MQWNAPLCAILNNEYIRNYSRDYNTYSYATAYAVAEQEKECKQQEKENKDRE